jgi:hypothetical protein
VKNCVILGTKEFDNIKKEIYDKGEEMGQRKARKYKGDLPHGTNMVTMTAQEHKEHYDKAFRDGYNSIMSDPELVIYHKDNLKSHDKEVEEEAYIKGKTEGFEDGVKVGVAEQKDNQRLEKEKLHNSIRESAAELKPMIEHLKQLKLIEESTTELKPLSSMFPDLHIKGIYVEYPINIDATRLTEQELKELLIKVKDAYLPQNSVEVDDCKFCGECMREDETPRYKYIFLNSTPLTKHFSHCVYDNDENISVAWFMDEQVCKRYIDFLNRGI